MKTTKRWRPPFGSPTTLADWQPRAERELKALLKKAYTFSALRKRLGQGVRCPAWTVDVRMVGAAAMKRLNGQYRGKPYATDVLSFPAPAPFRAQGHLGELVICLPVLNRQARELEHAPAIELRVLLAHGILHLLDMDHELGDREAKEMARWEQRLLPGSLGLGLIARIA